MTFAAPLFLLAMAAAAIPVVLHMIHRRTARQLPFATLRFVKLSAQKTRRRKRVQDLLLMMMRAAILLLIALGLAQPMVAALGSLWGSSRADIVIVLDNSASMGTVDADRPRFEAALAAAAGILDQVVEGDRVALLPACGPAFEESGRLERVQDSGRKLLSQCRVAYERADLAANLRQAAALLATSDADKKQIYLLTDLQQASWKGLPSPQNNNKRRPIGAGATVLVVDCSRAPKPNVGIEGLNVQAVAPLAGLPVTVNLTLLNTSPLPDQRVVELLVDGVREAASPELNVPPNGRTNHQFTFRCRRGGLHRGEARLLGQDGSAFDDRRFFAVNVDQNVRVAVVKSRQHEIAHLDDAYYLEKALDAGSGDHKAFQVSTLLPGDLLRESLGKYKVIFCVNLPAISPEAAERFESYVAEGGSLVWFCGDNIDPEAYNAMNAQARGRLLPAALLARRTADQTESRDSWHIASLDASHPALKAAAEPRSLYESVLIYQHVPLAVKEADAAVLAKLDDGQPLLIERAIGEGRTLLFGTGAQPSWSNLPLRPVFLPLVMQLTLELAHVAPTQSSVIAGQPLVLDRLVGKDPALVEVIPPTVETLRLKTVADAASGRQVFQYRETHDIGIYRLRVLDAVNPRQLAYAVNLDPDEVDQTKIAHSQLQQQGKPASLIVINDDALPEVLVSLREGKSLWGIFLAAVLVVLVFETFLSNRFGAQSTATAPTAQSG